MTPESALIIPVPEAEQVVRSHRARHDPTAPQGIPAHITILYPFKTPKTIGQSVIDELREILAGVTPFSFALTAVGQFPDVVYLVPEPPEAFIRLTAAIATRWPEVPPYEGEFEQVIPHLTVAHTEDAATGNELRRHIEPSLPITCRAHHAWLLTSRDGQWRTREMFPFAPESS